jgi:hypothetical protein
MNISKNIASHSQWRSNEHSRKHTTDDASEKGHTEVIAMYQPVKVNLSQQEIKAHIKMKLQDFLGHLLIANVGNNNYMSVYDYHLQMNLSNRVFTYI